MGRKYKNPYTTLRAGARAVVSVVVLCCWCYVCWLLCCVLKSLVNNQAENMFLPS